MSMASESPVQIRVRNFSIYSHKVNSSVFGKCSASLTLPNTDGNMNSVNREHDRSNSGHLNLPPVTTRFTHKAKPVVSFSLPPVQFKPSSEPPISSFNSPSNTFGAQVEEEIALPLLLRWGCSMWS